MILISGISLKEVGANRMHMTTSLRSSVASQTLFYRGQLQDLLQTISRSEQIKNSDSARNSDLKMNTNGQNSGASKRKRRVSIKEKMTFLCALEREFLCEYERKKESGKFEMVLRYYRDILFVLIDFFESYIAKMAEGTAQRKLGVSKKDIG